MKKILEKITTLEGAFISAAIIIPLAYVIGIVLLSLFSGKSFNQVIIYTYDPVYYAFGYLVSFLIKPVVVICAFLLIASFPGILFSLFFVRDKIKFGLVRFFTLGFVFNITFLFLGTTFLKLFGIAIDRLWFISIIFAGTVVAVTLFFIRKIPFTRYDFSKHKKTIFYFIFLLFLILIFIIVFQQDVLRPLPEGFDYNLQSVIEKGAMNLSPRYVEMGVAHYLKTKIFPYWLVEYTGKFGFFMWTPPLPYFIDFFNTTLLGDSYAAFSLLFLFFTSIIFLFVYKMICIDDFGCKKKSMLFYIGPALFLCSFLWLYMLPYRRPDLSPLTWPSNNYLFNTLQGLWAFLIIGIVYFMLNRELTFAFVLGILATLARYETIPIIYLLLTINYFFNNKDVIFLKSFLKKYSIFVVLFIFSIFVITLTHENGIKYLQGLISDKIFIRLEFLRSRFAMDTVHKIILKPNDIYNSLLFIKISMIATYFFIAIFLIPARDRISNFCSALGIIYFFAVLVQVLKLPCYAGLLIPLAAINIRRFIYPDIKYRWFSAIIYLVILCLGAYYVTVILKTFNAA